MSRRVEGIDRRRLRHAYDAWAPTYPPTAHTALMRVEERAMLSRLARSLEGRRVLDVGCGTGRYLRLALLRGARQVAGVDVTWAMLARTPRHASESGRRVGLVQGAAETLPFADGLFDVTISGLTIGHVPVLVQALGELARVTRSGGQVLVSDLHPVGETLGWTRTFSVGGVRHVIPHVTHRLDDWEDACGRVGLDIVARLEPALRQADLLPDARADSLPFDVPAALVIDARRRGR